MKNRIYWPAIIVLSAVLAGVASIGVLGRFLQFFIVSWFIMVIPGMAYIRLIRSLQPLPRWVLAITMSIVFATFISLFMALTRSWHPIRGLMVLIVISVIGAALQLIFTPWNE